MMSFIHSGSEIRIYMVSNGNKLDCIACYMRAQFFILASYLIKNVLIPFDDDAENVLLSILMYLQILSTCICNGQPKSKSIFEFSSHRQTML